MPRRTTQGFNIVYFARQQKLAGVLGGPLIQKIKDLIIEGITEGEPEVHHEAFRNCLAMLSNVDAFLRKTRVPGAMKVNTGQFRKGHPT